MPQKKEEKIILTDSVNRRKFLKGIGIDTENITDEIKELYDKKLSLSRNDIKHGKFMAERTLREVILLQVEEWNSLVEFNKNDNFFRGLSSANLDRKINLSLIFLLSR